MTASPSGRAVLGMSLSIIEAVRLAQRRCLSTDSAAAQHRLELALDVLLRHPDAEGDPARLLDNALANARTKLRRRVAICHIVSSPALIEDAPGPSAEVAKDLETIIIEATDVLKRSRLSSADRALLLWSVADIDAEKVGELIGAAPRQVRERLSRARGRARAALYADLVTV